MKYLSIALLASLLSWNSLQAQDTERAAIIQTVDDFFVAMEAKDTSRLDSLLHDNCILFSSFEKDDQAQIQPLLKASFLGFLKLAIKKKYQYDERLWSYDLMRSKNMAVVWTDYSLFAGKEMALSHCGVNSFTLAKNLTGQWVILSISDTRYKEDCIEEQTVETDEKRIHELMDNWHLAAATADADAFFGTMTEDGIYLGTDASERWLRDELRTWSKAAFERESAWDFKASKRQLYFSADYKTAWFEELLDTWMGTCRGSGVLVKQGGVWKLKHYDLAIMVPNDLVKDFITLVEEGGLPKSKKKRKKAKKKS